MWRGIPDSGDTSLEMLQAKADAQSSRVACSRTAMTALSAAVFVLLLGAVVCFLPLRSAIHATVGTLSQIVAMGLAWSLAIPALTAGAPLIDELP